MAAYTPQVHESIENIIKKILMANYLKMCHKSQNLLANWTLASVSEAFEI